MESESGLTFKMNKYQQELTKAMKWLGKKNNIIFLGQTVMFPGSPMYPTLKNVPNYKKHELPVMEECQMGISIGLALEDFIPISIYPRMDFLICAMNQLINHLNHCEEMSHGEFTPGVIVRTMVGNREPLYPGKQHCGDYTIGLVAMCDNIVVKKLMKESQIMDAYKCAYQRALKGKSTILIEMPQGGIRKDA